LLNIVEYLFIYYIKWNTNPEPSPARREGRPNRAWTSAFLASNVSELEYLPNYHIILSARSNHDETSVRSQSQDINLELDNAEGLLDQRIFNI
jgi:hypothetical protein